jgi:hypothetical protein
MLTHSPAAYKEANGMKLGDRYIVVDVERGRTVEGWHPRRMGGGLGGRDYSKAQKFKGFGAPNGPGGTSTNKSSAPSPQESNDSRVKESDETV